MAYSGNINDLNDAVEALRGAEVKVLVRHWWEPIAFVFKAYIRIETESGSLIADTTLFHADDDCLMMMETSWLRGVRKDLEDWL